MSEIIRRRGPIDILLVEDNPADVRLTREALAEARVASSLSVVRDGVEAMAFLRRKGKYAKSTRPDLVLLDLNMPRKSGREVLQEMKTDPELRRIPVVVLTTSQAPDDISKAYQLNANCFVTKPVDFHRFIEIIQAIHHFWLRVATLPSE